MTGKWQCSGEFPFPKGVFTVSQSGCTGSAMDAMNNVLTFTVSGRMIAGTGVTTNGGTTYTFAITSNVNEMVTEVRSPSVPAFQFICHKELGK